MRQVISVSRFLKNMEDRLRFVYKRYSGPSIGRWNYALALSWVAHENLCLNNIFRNADASLKAKYLPGLCSGFRWVLWV